MTIEAGRRQGIAGPAVAILEGNWNGSHTLPATGLYPHQWSWDSAFIAMGLANVSPRRAGQELDALLSGQWEDGRIPQIIFDIHRDRDYAPGAAFWRSDLMDDSPDELRTAGLVQPPNHAWAVWRVHTFDPVESEKRGLLRRAYPRLVAWHSYLLGRRDRGGNGLAAAVHPWETGTDNSPLWDVALKRVPAEASTPILRPDLKHAGAGERPSQREYHRYFHLAERYRDHDCDDVDPSYPFLVEDPAFNALLALSELALARIADAIGEDAAPHLDRYQGIIAAMEGLFDPELGCYVARDLVGGTLVRKATVNGLIPLLLPDGPHRAALIDTVNGPRFLGSGATMVPSYDATAADFDRRLYWRGPAWFNMNWMIALGLHAAGEVEAADRITEASIRSAAEGEFAEYVDAWTGAPYGTRRFSWTAALTLDLERQPDRPIL